MINSIIEAISKAIKNEFGNGYTRYMEEVKQGLNKPCFFILCINPTKKLFKKGRYFRTNQFCIQYLSKSENNGRRECNEVAERLLSCLEWLTICGNPVMGTKKEFEIVDGILHFFVNYDMFVSGTQDEPPKMEDLKEELSVKG